MCCVCAPKAFCWVAAPKFSDLIERTVYGQASQTKADGVGSWNCTVTSNGVPRPMIGDALHRFGVDGSNPECLVTNAKAGTPKGTSRIIDSEPLPSHLWCSLRPPRPRDRD